MWLYGRKLIFLKKCLTRRQVSLTWSSSIDLWSTGIVGLKIYISGIVGLIPFLIGQYTYFSNKTIVTGVDAGFRKRIQLYKGGSVC